MDAVDPNSGSGFPVVNHNQRLKKEFIRISFGQDDAYE